MENVLVHRRDLRPQWAPLLPLDRWLEDVRMPADGALRLDVTECEASYRVIVDAPGATREDVDLTLERNRLTISVTRTEEAADEGVRTIRRERSVGTQTRTLRFPQRVDADGVEATYRDGVLTINVPKSAEDRARRITVG